jgi:hypothetical protein
MQTTIIILVAVIFIMALYLMYIVPELFSGRTVLQSLIRNNENLKQAVIDERALKNQWQMKYNISVFGDPNLPFILPVVTEIDGHAPDSFCEHFGITTERGQELEKAAKDVIAIHFYPDFNAIELFRSVTGQATNIEEFAMLCCVAADQIEMLRRGDIFFCEEIAFLHQEYQLNNN